MGEHQFPTPESKSEGKDERIGLFGTTVTGREFYSLDLRPSEVDINDIANSLSRICRFNGHCTDHWSVAQHSVLISQYVDRIRLEGVHVHDSRDDWILPMWGLLHDAHETYLGDVIRPLKYMLFKLCPEFKAAFDRADVAILEKFRVGEVPKYVSLTVQLWDNRMLEAEVLKWRPKGLLNRVCDEQAEPAPGWEHWESWSADVAREKFLARFWELDLRRFGNIGGHGE